MELLTRVQSGRNLPWPNNHNPSVLHVSPLNNMLRRVSSTPVHPSMSWWNDYRGIPTGFEDPDFNFVPTNDCDDCCFPAVPGTSGSSTIQAFNQKHNQSNERITLLDLLKYMTKEDNHLTDIERMYQPPTVDQLIENKRRLTAWDNEYNNAGEKGKEGIAAFGKRENDFSTAKVSAALREVAVFTPELRAAIQAEEMSNKRKRGEPSKQGRNKMGNKNKTHGKDDSKKNTKKKRRSK
jgi:hypothetical protein